MSRPSLSLVVSCRSRRPYLRRCFEAVARQGYPSLDLLFVDHASDDESADEAARVARALGLPVRVLSAPASPGPGLGRRRGLAEARGAYVAFLNPEDTLGDGQLASAVDALERHPACDLALRDWEVWVERAGGAPVFEPWPALDAVDVRHEAVAGVPYPLSSLVLRRAFAARADEQGAFDPQVEAGSERVALLMMGALGARAVRAPGRPTRVGSRASAFASRPGREAERARALAAAFARVRALVAAHGEPLSAFEAVALAQPWQAFRLRETAPRWTDTDFVAAGAPAPLTSREVAVLLRLGRHGPALRGQTLDVFRRHLWYEFGWRRAAMGPLVRALEGLRQAGLIVPLDEGEAGATRG